MLDADTAYIEALRRQTPAQKLAAIHQLRRTAWALKAAWIRQCEPGLTESEVQTRVRRLFLHAVT
ncbi:MAG TPA: hypothetical protein VNU46_02155 [Gemmatimonadaceae bacterium]|jgi:hypothetical protein|nr:hypothetical protein [Gemmatimonadaceae bacterium]